MYTKCDIMIVKGVNAMSTVRINDEIKKEVVPILSDLGLSLSEAINIFLHQVKLSNGIPFEVKRKNIVELNDGYGSYICEYGHLHDYSKIDFKELEEDRIPTVYNSADELAKDIEGEE